MPKPSRRIALSALLSLALVALLTTRAAAFEGCDVTGTWNTGFNEGALVEDASGNIVGSTYDDSNGSGTLSGSRSAATVTWTGIGPLNTTFSGTMSDCNTISGTVTFTGGSIPITLVRIRNTYCGDGTEDPEEECDDHNFVDGDLCTAGCDDAECGNKIVEAAIGEECDDGNLVNGDGCSNGCQVIDCGNGDLEPGEACDDGNGIQGDGCSNDCFVNVCGNSVPEPGEICDDGNVVPGDGCSELCQFEGCLLTGMWETNGVLFSTYVEDGSGHVQGVSYDGTDGSYGTSTGTRFGATITGSFTDGTVSGTTSFTMTDCDHISGTVTINSTTIPLTSSRIRSTYCGDGTIDGADGELCDDHNLANDDLCTVRCLPADCGDRIVSPANGEECDDGNADNGDGCTNDCNATICGDGTPEQGEECDDGNDVQGDGCSSTCLANVCGNDTIEDGESCDDGNAASGDGCSSLCQFEGCDVTGTWDSAANRSSLDEAPDGSFVGVVDDPQNGISAVTGVRTGSEISWAFTLGGQPSTADGVLTDCDSMLLTVHLPGGQTIPNFAVNRVRTTYCGDGTRQPSAGEECDDGNFVDADACPIDCVLPNCGDGAPDPLEACDDGNANEGDACKNDCTLNVCGDGVPRAGVEQCDLGAANSEAPNGTCRTDCKLRRCGDGVLDAGAGEECDDGGTVTGDGCDSRCLEEVTVTETVPPNPPAPVVITTDPGGNGATPEAPVQAAVTTSIPGPVSITVTSIDAATPSGFTLIGKQVNITASPGTVANPLTFTFVVDASQVPADPSTLTVFRNEALVPDCLGATQPTPNDPCIKARTVLGSGDVSLAVLTTHASVWNVGIQLSFDKAQQTCRKEVRKLVGNYLKARLLGMQKCIDKVNSAKQGGTCPDPRTASNLAKAAAKIDPAKLAKKCPPALVAGLHPNGACSGATTLAGLTSCMVAAVDSSATALLETEYASPSTVLPDKPTRQCQAAIAKESGLYANARLKAFSGCQSLQDRDKVASCLDAKATATVALAKTKLVANPPKKCSSPAVGVLAGLGFGRSCAAAVTVTDLSSCQATEADLQVQPLAKLLP